MSAHAYTTTGQKCKNFVRKDYVRPKYLWVNRDEVHTESESLRDPGPAAQTHSETRPHVAVDKGFARSAATRKNVTKSWRYLNGMIARKIAHGVDNLLNKTLPKLFMKLGQESDASNASNASNASDSGIIARQPAPAGEANSTGIRKL